MPLVMVKRNSEKVPDTLYGHMTHYLREWTAEALSVPGTAGELTPEDVEVWASDKGQGTADLSVVVFANNYPERALDLGKRQGRMARALAAFLKGSCPGENIRGSVWILLQEPTFFGVFET